MRKTTQLRRMIQSGSLEFLMEAHNGLSAKLAAEAGFEALWASGLSMSAALGVRDNNEASWTQSLDVVEFMADASTLPILFDGDSGYGNFNNVRRLVRKLEQRGESGAAADTKPAAAEAEASPAETRAYQAALDQFKLGNYALAVSAMQGFMVTYPNSPLAPNAQYWIGMAHSGQREYKGAIAAQRKLLAAWPDNPKAPDAMLSIASAQETMGAKGEAQKTLQELIARYPGSSASVSARQRLAASAKR